MAAAGLVPQFASPASPDVSWLLYSAGRLLDGARLAVDVVEINPPLIVWLNLPPALIARELGVPDAQVYRVLVAAAGAAALLAAAAILRRDPAASTPRERRGLLLLATFVVFALPGAEFGEREHLLLILALPYVLLAAARRRGEKLPPVAGFLVGVSAGVGIAIKPYFLLLPIALEAWLAAGRSARTVRPETLGILLVLGAYAVAVALFGRDYLELVRSLGAEYVGFLRDPLLLTALAGAGAGLPLAALLASIALRDRLRGQPLALALLVATAALYGSAVLQQKGWRYHFYPAMGTALLLLALLARAAWGSRLTLAARLYAAAAAAMVIFVPLRTAVEGVLELRRPRLARFAADPDLGALVRLIRAQAPGGSLLVLSTNMASAFPLVPEAGASWTSRFPSLWLFGASYRKQLADTAPLAYRAADHQPEAERMLNRAVVEDLRRGRPDLIVELRPAPDRWDWGIRRLDYIGYLSRDPGFAAEISRYGYLADVGEYRVYRRLAGDAPPPAPPPDREPPAAPPPRALGAGVQLAPLGAAAIVEAGMFLALMALCWARIARPRG